MKPIDSMYVDTTFCVPEAFFIPSRDDCLAATASLVNSWLQRSADHFVNISSRSKYGHEPLLAHLAAETGSKIHTSKARVLIYDQISELQGVFTADPSVRIHACPWQECKGLDSVGPRLPCGYSPVRPNTDSASTSCFVKVMVIRPSTMWFTAQPTRLQELVVSPVSGRGLHRVCYSFHSSYTELRDLVSLLRPARVFPNVLPASDTSWDQVTARLRSFLTYQHKRYLSPAEESMASKPLGVLKRKRTASAHSMTSSEELVFDSPDKGKLTLGDKCKKARHSFSQENKLPDNISPSKSDIISPSKSLTSDAHSSYQDSDCDSGTDLFACDDLETTPMKTCSQPGPSGQWDYEAANVQGSESLRSYVSGDEDVEEDQISASEFHELGSCKDVDDNTSVQTERIHASVSSSSRKLFHSPEKADGDEKLSSDAVKTSKASTDAGDSPSNPPPPAPVSASQNQDDIIVIHSSQSSTEECHQAKTKRHSQSSAEHSSSVAVTNQSSKQPSQKHASGSGKSNASCSQKTESRVKSSQGSEAVPQDFVAGSRSVGACKRHEVHNSSDSLDKRDARSNGHSVISSGVIDVDDISSSPTEVVPAQEPCIKLKHDKAVSSRMGKELESRGSEQSRHCKKATSTSGGADQQMDSNSYDSDDTIPPDSPLRLTTQLCGILKPNPSMNEGAMCEENTRKRLKHQQSPCVIDLTQDSSQ